MNSPTVLSASLALFARYAGVLAAAKPVKEAAAGTDVPHLRWMCETAQADGHTWPEDKLSRWLGFVQGVMTARGLLTVAEEREFSRPLFHAAYQAAGSACPPSVYPIN